MLGLERRSGKKAVASDEWLVARKGQCRVMSDEKEQWRVMSDEWLEKRRSLTRSRRFGMTAVPKMDITIGIHV